MRGEQIITKTVIYYFTEIVEMGFHCRSGNMELVCSQQAIKCIIISIDYNNNCCMRKNSVFI